MKIYVGASRKIEGNFDQRFKIFRRQPRFTRVPQYNVVFIGECDGRADHRGRQKNRGVPHFPFKFLRTKKKKT